MQRELALDIQRPLADALTQALASMIDEARAQVARALAEPSAAMHDYRRAVRRAEALVALAWPVLRKVPRRWLARSLTRARRRTRIVRDLDAVLPVLKRLTELELVTRDDGTLPALEAWLQACRSELASDEIVAWRLRKNVRALAGAAEIFAAAIHTWSDLEILLDRMRDSYRAAKRAFKEARRTREREDVHAFRRATRALRYQLELLASAEPRPAEPVASAPGEPAEEPPLWLEGVRDLHRTMKALARELGDVSDLYALRAIVDELDDDAVDFRALSSVLAELADARVERILGDAERAFATPAKQLLVTPHAPVPAVASGASADGSTASPATHAAASD